MPERCNLKAKCIEFRSIWSSLNSWTNLVNTSFPLVWSKHCLTNTYNNTFATDIFPYLIRAFPLLSFLPETVFFLNAKNTYKCIQISTVWGNINCIGLQCLTALKSINRFVTVCIIRSMNFYAWLALWIITLRRKNVFLCYNAGGMREGMKGRAGVRLCSVHPQKGWVWSRTRCLGMRWGRSPNQELALHINCLCAGTQPLRDADCSPLKWRARLNRCLRHPKLWLPRSCGYRRERAEFCLCRIQEELAQLCPAGTTWFFMLSLQSWLKWWILPVFLLCWKQHRTGWECPSISWFCFIPSPFNIVVTHFQVPDSRRLFCGMSNAISASFASENRSALLLLVPFARIVLVQLLCNIWHFSPSPRSLPLFYEGLSCVLSSNPFKIPCTFLNDGNPLTRQGRWESWEPHQRGLLNLLWQQGRDARTCLI